MQQPSAQGIAALFRGNPQPLQQRIQQEQQAKPGIPPDLQKLLALNIVTNEQDAVAKQKAMDQLSQMQGGPQGQMPTVMQSVQEQARQKMEAQSVQAQQQQQQQQQGIQALMQQAGPAPVPPETPQPQAQPQGIDELPVNFQMAGGGIVAFEGGGTVEDILQKSPQERTAEENAILERSGVKLERQHIPQDSGIRRIEEALQKIGPGIRGYFTEGANQLSDEELANQPAVGGAQNERILRAIGMGRSAPPPSAPQQSVEVPISRPTSQMTPQQIEAAVKSAPSPIADLRALAEQQQRQQAPRPARPAMAAPVAPAAPSPEVQAAQVPAQESLQRQLLLKALSSDPEAARISEQERRKREVGTPDTTQYDKLVEEMEKRKAQLEGPKDQWGQLMEYLGQVSATPRGLSSFEAGAAGVRGVKALEKTRQLEQYNLTKQAADVAQKKLDTVRAFAEKQYDVGKSVFDKEYERQFDAAKQLELSDKEAARLAQENTLKRLEIASAEKRNEASVAAQRYSADRGQAKTDAEEARNKQYQDLMAQSRRLTASGDKAGAAEAAARAADIAAISGRASAASGLAGPKPMTRDQAEDNVRKDLEDFRVGPKLMNDATAALKASGIANPTTLQIKEYLVQQNMKGVNLAAPIQTGKVPPLPPGFKLN